MTRHTPIARGAFVLGLVLVAASLAWPRQSGSGGEGPGPVLMASVNVQRVFNECVLKAEAELRLQEVKDAFNRELEALRTQAKALKADLDLLMPGTEKHRETEKKLKDATIAFQAREKFAEARLAEANNRAKGEVLREINQAVADYSRKHGIAYMVNDDSTIAEGDDPRLVQEIALRRVVFADPAFDVTDDVIAWINK